VAGRENIQYLTGFSGSEGWLLITGDDVVLMVDGRYITQARNEASGCRVQLVEGGIKGVGTEMRVHGVSAWGVEAEGLSVATFEELRKEADDLDIVPVSAALRRLRGHKAPEELQKIKEAVTIAEQAWERIVSMIVPGGSEHTLAVEFEYAMRKMGGDRIAFDLIVASGPRSALPHARPSSRTLEPGDFVIFDFGVCHRGYHSDETRTVAIGKVSDEQHRVYGVVRDAHDAAIERVKPGVMLAEVDAAARDFIAEAGFGEYFGHGTGHGVGLAIHDWPTVNANSRDTVQEGMVFTIEPGIYIPQWGGVRIEDMIVVTADGCETLTNLSTDLIIVEH
jgi:Xaa-Pro aminopeptidase